LADKPESYSFDFDYFTILKDGTITYENVFKYTGFGNSEFYNIEGILLNIHRFDLIIHRTSLQDIVIYPETINFDKEPIRTSLKGSFLESSKIKGLSIKPKATWEFIDDVEIFEHLPAIRREIKLKSIGI
jgi:hypothetical protein